MIRSLMTSFIVVTPLIAFDIPKYYSKKEVLSRAASWLLNESKYFDVVSSRICRDKLYMNQSNDCCLRRTW